MKHHPKASPPYFEVAPGVRVEYPGSDLDDDTGPDLISVRVDGKEVQTLWICEDPEAEAKGRAEEIQAVYDKGREDERAAAHLARTGVQISEPPRTPRPAWRLKVKGSPVAS